MRSSAMEKSGSPAKVIDARGPEAFEQLMRVERESSQIFYSLPMFLPGPFQSEGYAREMLSGIAHPAPTGGELADRLRVRMNRAAAFRERLDGDTPPRVWAVLDEAALRRTRDAAMMREQIDHLLELSQKDTVHLAVMPLSAGPTALLGGSFEVHEAAEGETSVFFEGRYQDEIIGPDQARAEYYRDLVRTLLATAASESAATSLLVDIRDSL
ncbi:DUF5753 domain-containing protein [Actinoplanes palleronii]|nr:DUF5753 domain-containing protein [Actinoplanes palleronii]